MTDQNKESRVIWSALLPEIFVFIATPLCAWLTLHTYTAQLTHEPVIEPSGAESSQLIALFVGGAVLTIVMLWLVRRRRGGALLQGLLYLALFQGVMIVTQAWFASEVSFILSVIIVIVYAFRPWIWLHDLLLVIALAGIGILLGVQFSLRALVIAAAVLLVYDAIAVWKSRHMVTLVKGMAAQRVFLGFVFPHRGARYRELVRSLTTLSELSFLGTGDVVIPTMLVVSASFTAVELAMGALLGACVGFGVLLGASYRASSGRMYPGLPFIVTGALLGLFLANL